MQRCLDVIDALSRWLAFGARCVLVALVLAMVFEVFSRYVLDAPTLWSFDLSYMLNGTIFLLGAGYALQHDDHVRIDFLATRLPARVRWGVEAVVFGLLVTPLMAAVAWIAVTKAYRAFVTGEVQTVSPWAPLMWPFYSVIALGLVVFALQCLARGLRAAAVTLRPASPVAVRAVEEGA